MSLTAMEEAFKKSGKVSEADIQKREDDRQRILKEEQEKIKRDVQSLYEIDQQEQQEVLKKYKVFNDMWNDYTKKKFLTHLVFAYTPSDVAHYPWSDDELKVPKCCICRHDLITKEFIFKNLSKFASHSVEQITKLARGEEIYPRKEFEKEFGNNLMAVVSEYSSAAFCNPCFQDFYAWIQYMILRGNPQIHQIISRRRLELSLTAEQLQEHDLILKEKDHKVRQQKMLEFSEKILKIKNERENYGLSKN